MRPLIAGNWKMHGLRADAIGFAVSLRARAGQLDCDLLVCPPATLVDAMSQTLAGAPVAVGGQDCHACMLGAHTGDVSAAMLRDVGATWVIVGHSERRADHHETDAEVRAKAQAAITARLRPIVCVGESASQRLAGRADEVVGRQLDGSLPDAFADGAGGVVAYEPIWAIGSGRIPSQSEIGDMHRFIRARLVGRFGSAGSGLRILYGGSVKPDNAASVLAVAEVGGALVGGASLQPESFLAIAEAATADRLAADR
jgi:triosephosphate isomerase (TIM)